MKIIINAELQDIPQKTTPINGCNDFWVHCLSALGYNATYPPVADLLRRYHGEPAGRWLVMTPVHGQVTHNDAMLVQAGASFHFTEAQSRIWFEEIKQFLAADPLTFVYHDPAYWLVRLPDDDSIPQPHSPHVQHILHQSLMPYLTQLDSTQYWQRLLTELQMFMSAHPLNTGHAIQRGEVVSCNGVWFWGGGVLERQLDDAPYPAFLTDDPQLLDIFKQGELWQDIGYRMLPNAVVMLSAVQPGFLQVLQERNARIACDWYWNNTAYHQKRRTLFERLRAFCRAHR